MDSSLINTLVAAVAFAAAFAGVRTYAYFKAKRQARRTAALHHPSRLPNQATSMGRPLNRAKRKRMARQSSSR